MSHFYVSIFVMLMASSATFAVEPRNVLFIAVDDLRPQFALLGLVRH